MVVSVFPLVIINLCKECHTSHSSVPPKLGGAIPVQYLDVKAPHDVYRHPQYLVHIATSTTATLQFGEQLLA